MRIKILVIMVLMFVCVIAKSPLNLIKANGDLPSMPGFTYRLYFGASIVQVTLYSNKKIVSDKHYFYHFENDRVYVLSSRNGSIISVMTYIVSKQDLRFNKSDLLSLIDCN